MKALIICLMVLSATLVANPDSTNKARVQQELEGRNSGKNTGIFNPCIPQTKAEKILGHSAILLESSSENLNGVTKFRCTYSATFLDSEIQKTSNLYYLLEEYENADLSRKTFADIIGQNQNMSGLHKVNQIGDEAFLHTDNENFVLLISRKDNKVLRLKVNKLTSKTSSYELRNFSKSIMAAL